MNNHKAYLVLITFLLTCIGIKYHVSSEANFFQQPNLITLLFITALFSHVLIVSTGDMTNKITKVTFHASGMVGCETLLKNLLVDFIWYCTINFILLLLAFFGNYVTQLSPAANVDLVPNPEPQAQDIQIVGGAYPPIDNTQLLPGTSSNVDSVSTAEPPAQDTQV